MVSLGSSSKKLQKIFGIASVLAVTILVSNLMLVSKNKPWTQFIPSGNYQTYPLVMSSGNPYIRALMRTITASEANVPEPYHVIYGGGYIADLSQHPAKCVPILRGPNVGNCTTAAGRYQFLDTTWYEKAQHYHPNPSKFFWWKSYSFEPEYQDEVVYAWLNDSGVWGVDIAQLLRQGRVEEVLRLLSGTWTSLGYGIESNSMSSQLPKIYQKMLQEELEQSHS